MNPYIPISLRRQALQKLSAVRNGQLSREVAEKKLKDRLRYSSKLREEIIAGLTADYDKQAVEALEYFRLI